MESFNDLNLSAPLMRAITELGFEKPSPVQALSLPLLLEKPTDFLGLAATGTGKTAAFAIPMLERIAPTKRVVQTLILCPTRELAVQVAGQIDLLGKYIGVRALPVYGGASYSDQIHGLKAGAKVVVGTPGRVIDHIEKGTLRLEDVTTVILDEADEMISMGFREDIESILKTVNKEQSNIWLFSATMSREVRRVADMFLKNPQTVQVNRTEMLPSTVEQLYYMTHESNKPEILCKLIDAAEDFYGLVFCQTKSLVSDLTTYLTERGYKVDCLHGDKDQKSRERTMQAFRDRKVKMLICTDVASRGLDVKDITHVINYSIPRELDSYVHRIGRTARSGKTGFAMSLVTPSHRRLIAQIEQMTKSRMQEGRIPTRKEIGAKKTTKVLEKFLEQNLHAKASELLDDTWKEKLAAMPAEEIAGRFLSLLFPDVFTAEREAPVITREPRAESGGARNYGSRRDGAPRPSVGRREGGFNPGGPRREGGFNPGGPRREGGFNPGGPRREGGFNPGGPRREGGFNPGGPRRESGIKPVGLPQESGYSSTNSRRRDGAGETRPVAASPFEAPSRDAAARPTRPGGWGPKRPVGNAATSSAANAGSGFQDRPPRRMKASKTESPSARKSQSL